MDDNLPKKLQVAFELQKEGKLEEAHGYFLDGIQELCRRDDISETHRAAALVSDITHPITQAYTTQTTANHLAFVDLDQAKTYVNTFPTQLLNDAWYLEVLHADTPAENKSAADFIKKIITIGTPQIRDMAIDTLLINKLPAEWVEPLVEAATSPHLKEQIKLHA